MNYMPPFAPGARRVEKFMVPWEIVDKRRVYRRDGWLCVYCKTPVGDRDDGEQFWPLATADHVVPISLGGSHTYANIVTACERCNFDKGADPDLVDVGILLQILDRTA